MVPGVRRARIIGGRRVILAGGVLLAAGLFGLSWAGRVHTARLISIEEVPDAGDSCYRPASTGSLPEQSLFAEFAETPVHAQDAAASVELARPPVRDILDTSPIYSSV